VFLWGPRGGAPARRRVAKASRKAISAIGAGATLDSTRTGLSLAGDTSEKEHI
jgi:hypothetical protein